MKTERWFNVLVLGGATLGQACGTTQEARPKPRGTEGGGGGTGGSTGGLGGASSPGGGGASTGGTAGSSGVSTAGASEAGGGSSVGGAHSSGSGGGSPGGATSGGGGASGAGGVASLGGSGGELQCMIDASGHGDARDPCGCPCCWAKDCLNTETPCCVGFCKGGDEGRGCCPP